MSEDGFSDGSEEPSMEIQIKTLMGTMFDIKVSSTETVGDIKKKIYRVEGIPIYQQNLIFQSKELKDANRLCDAGVRNGSTLTLVASMRGGPISTRRLSVACEHHVVLKELKDLLENTREEMVPGSKVSVLVFKEGDIINLLRVIENDDGSYSPYNEKPISPPAKPTRKESRIGIFERLVEDNEMSARMANLRKKMEEFRLRQQKRTGRNAEDGYADGLEGKLFGEASGPGPAASSKGNMPFRFLGDCNGRHHIGGAAGGLKIYEKSYVVEEENEEEIALKDKHRSKPHRLPKSKSKSLYGESKGAHSSTKQNYARIHKRAREVRAGEGTSRDRPVDEEPKSTLDRQQVTSALAEQFAVLEEDNQDKYGEALARNRVPLARLVLSESVERPKSSPEGIELEENAQDLWEIHEPAADRLKHSATCEVGMLKRRQSLDYGRYEGLENAAPKPDLGNYSCKNADFEVCSGNFYRVPQFVSAPSAIPPQYAPKDRSLCDYYFSKPNRSPLYGRKGKEERIGTADEPEKAEKFGSFLGECSSIQRLKNDVSERKDELYGYCNPGCSAADEEVAKEKTISNGTELPPVTKKKSRCGECNKRLNITNIYDCRCGRIFCSQHRYPEAHRCGYDYKSEGRKILERQNPLVTSEKVRRI